MAEQGKNGAEMSRAIGLSNSIYSQWNTGKTKPSKRTLPLIAQYLGTTTEYLLGVDQEKKLLINEDEELTEYLDELRSRPEKRLLFSVTKNATKAQIEAIVKMIEEMQGN